MEKTEILSSYRTNIWSYFSLHAEQRLKTFNFYLIVATILVSGYIGLLKEDLYSNFLFILPLLLSIISFVFWKLDLRVKYMVKIAEQILNKIDLQLLSSLDDSLAKELNVFEKDHAFFYQYNIKHSKFYTRLYSYSKCFNIVFFLLGFTGLLISFVELWNRLL
jgi:hypothetical protein